VDDVEPGDSSAIRHRQPPSSVIVTTTSLLSMCHLLFLNSEIGILLAQSL
jgi:hypothetical protein